MADGYKLDKGFLVDRKWEKQLRRLEPTQFHRLFWDLYDFQTYGNTPPEYNDPLMDTTGEFIAEHIQHRLNGAMRGGTPPPTPPPGGEGTPPNTKTNADTNAISITPPTPSEGAARTREKRFKPPTVDEVRVYCAERKNGVDPQRFVDYYTSNGWKVGKSPMKDWKAAVRNWEKNSRDKPLEQTHTDEEWDEFYELAVKRGLGEVG